MEIAEGCEVILSHEDVRVPQWRQRSWINRIVQLLCTKMNLNFWKYKVSAEYTASPIHLLLSHH
jgi:hypothetical protein